MKKLKLRQKLEYSILQPVDQTAWRTWLRDNHASSKGVWLTLRKKNSRQRGILLEEALDEAVSYGWIDSRLNVLDQDYYKLLFTPRKAGSAWSRSNKQRVQKLAVEGKMTAAGLAKVESAKRNGSWDKLNSIDELKIPRDLESAFESDSKARKHYGSVPDSVKKQILWWIETAKTPETRAKRIKQSLERLQIGNRHPFS